MRATATGPAVTAVAMAALALAAVATTVAAGPPVRAEEPGYFWHWSDGSEDATREFREPDDGLLPRLVVATSPATPGHRVLLQVRQDGEWRTEDAAVTSRTGVARLELNPYCADGGWCRAAFDYRLVAGGRTARLTVAFDR